MRNTKKSTKGERENLLATLSPKDTTLSPSLWSSRRPNLCQSNSEPYDPRLVRQQNDNLDRPKIRHL